MSDDDSQTARPRPIPHVRLYVVAALVAVAGGAGLALAAAQPTWRGMPALASAAAVMAVLIVIGTASMRRYELYDAARRGDTARLLEAMETLAHGIEDKLGREFASMAERVEVATAYQVAVEVQKAQRYADDLFERGMKEIDGQFAALERSGRALPRRRRRRTPRPEDVDSFLSAIDSGDNVVPMPDPRKVKGDDAS